MTDQFWTEIDAVDRRRFARLEERFGRCPLCQRAWPDADRKDITKLANRLRQRLQDLPYGDKTVGRVLRMEHGHGALEDVIKVSLQAGTFRKTLIEQRRIIDEALAKLEPVAAIEG